MANQPIPVLIIEGPTAAGKSQLALELAAKLQTEIISADSRQVYQYLDIGTAKPTDHEMAEVKHHLVNVISPVQTFNAGQFCQAALPIIDSLHAKGRIPVIAGGTGLYIKALLEGLFELEADTTEHRIMLQQEAEMLGMDGLYTQLKLIDAEAAAKINCKDKQRILRALEVYRATGIPMSEHWKQQSHYHRFRAYRILVNEERSVLYQRINQRVCTMLEKGLIAEIRALAERGISLTAPGFNSVGYKEFIPYLTGDVSLPECTQQAQQHTRNYAKRQYTWYRKCNFHLAEPLKEISINNVITKIEDYFFGK